MNFKIKKKNAPVLNEVVCYNGMGDNDLSLSVKREDLIHPEVSGNKFRKLKYNLLEAENQHKDTLLTFGGAFSNHIAATAAAGKEFGFKTIGIIRGEELAGDMEANPTLSYAHSCGMHLEFISREAYRKKDSEEFIQALRLKFEDFYLLPEGGTNSLAIKGCEEILTPEDSDFDYICVPVGTGGTMAGIINATEPYQQVIGFSALKGDFLNKEVSSYVTKNNWEVTDAFSFGGYGKVNAGLICFINNFKKETGIPLDPVYTGKMMYGITELAKAGKFKKKSRILAVHTGGLQGIAGMNAVLRKRNLPLIDL
jgi:1-aminocyclopropane-1-carboxylate deaminase